MDQIHWQTESHSQGRELWRVYLLGPTAVQRPDGSLIAGSDWPSPCVSALFAYLVWRNGRFIPSHTLSRDLWPDLPDERSWDVLNTAVDQLRRCLEPDLRRGSHSQCVLCRRNRYGLNPNMHCWLDVSAFEQSLRHARLEPNPFYAINLYEVALPLHRGEYLADIVNKNLVDAPRKRISRLYLDALVDLGRRYETIEQPEEAAGWYRQVLAADPTRDKVAQQLALILGEENAFLQQLTHCRNLSYTLYTLLDKFWRYELESVIRGEQGGDGRAV